MQAPLLASSCVLQPRRSQRHEGRLSLDRGGFERRRLVDVVRVGPVGREVEFGLVNAFGKPIVAKLIEKLKKCRTEKGKTVSSIEICDECENELECSVLEPIDLNIDLGTTTAAPTKQASTTIDDMPTVILTRINDLAEGANPFVLMPVSPHWYKPSNNVHSTPIPAPTTRQPEQQLACTFTWP